MQFYLLKLICLCFAAVVIFITQQVSDTEAHVEQHIGPLNVPNDYDVAYGPGNTDAENYYDMFEEAAKLSSYNEKRSSRIHVLRRGCIPRAGACDSRPNDCCYNSSCRCNLWGSNCRCQRMGLFQKWSIKIQDLQ